MRVYVFSLLCASLLLSCGQSADTAHRDILEAGEEDQIKKEIRAHMEVVMDGLLTNDPEKLFRDFWRSDSVSFYLNGMEMKGYDQIIDGFSQGMTTRKNTAIELTDESVMVLGRNAAMHLTGFTNEMIMTNDSVVKVAGYWSAVFKRINGEWKVVHVHESFNPVE